MRPSSVLYAAGLAAALSFAAPFLHAQQQDAPRAADGWHQTGSSVVVLDSADLANTGARTLSEALGARVPGLSVTQSSADLSAPSRIWLRGSEGYTGPSMPIVFVDGVQVDAGHPILSRLTFLSILDELPIASVERVELVRSAPGMAAYGAGGNRGILLITTKLPADGRIRSQLSISASGSRETSLIPANVRRFDTSGGGAQPCPRFEEALGDCVAGPLHSWSPAKALSPFQSATDRQVDGSLRGSVGGIQTGVFALHEGSEGIFLRSEASRSAGLLSLRGTPMENLEVSVVGRVHARSAVVPLAEGMTGSLGRAMLGDAVDDPERRGYREFTPAELASGDTESASIRVGSKVSARWIVTDRLALRFSAGYDRQTGRSENLLNPYGQSVAEVRTTEDQDLRTRTAQGSATFEHAFDPDVSGTAQVGVQVTSIDALESFWNWVTWSEGTNITHAHVSLKTGAVGLLLSERLVWRGARVLEIGVRQERLDVRGSPFGNETLPWVEASWSLAEESFFPRSAMMDHLRLRAAAARLVDPHQWRTSFGFAPTGAVTPLRQRVVELGAEWATVDRRLALELLYARRSSTDGAYLVPLPTSHGLHLAAQGDGRWSTSSTDALVSFTPLAGSSARWTSTVALTFPRTRLENQNPNPVFLAEPYVLPGGHSVLSGYRMAGLRGFTYSYADANGDGIIAREEVTRSGSSSEIASLTPTREVSWINRVSVGRRVSLVTQVDHRGGHQRFNSGEYLRCYLRMCAALYDPQASLAEQARAIAATNRIAEAFLEDASFTRLRDVSIKVDLPHVASFGSGSRASLTLSARNLALWTRFSGGDPEVGSYSGRLADEGAYFNAALPRRFIARLDIGM